jgi:hypothetical protein
MLAYGLVANATNEYYRIAKSTTVESMKQFCIVNQEVFKSTYIHQPIKLDIETQMEVNVRKGFPRMFFSIDYMHYKGRIVLFPSKANLKTRTKRGL